MSFAYVPAMYKLERKVPIERVSVATVTQFSELKLIFISLGDIVISPGGAARIPRVLESIYPESPLAIHSSAYVFSVDSLFDSISSRNPTPRPLRIAVLGCGQSAAEVTLNLRERLSNISPGPSGSSHEIEMIIRKGSLKPSDDSPFANEIFDPSGLCSPVILMSPNRY